MPPASKTFPEAIAAKDVRSLRYVFVNRAAEKLFGMPRASIMGKTARELFSPDLADMIEQGDRRVLGRDQRREVAAHTPLKPAGQRLYPGRPTALRRAGGVAHVV